ncbi:MAG TPA: sn-glycerol-3-phosphate ABC transporter ATP-binding protein UgpC [Solirubrobacteraceae bacterium]|nr:sn-glycerol-3-phosphate ABC transporter ATP-binding protein UgpC [Solirubrobacteraceae bacterium]
MADIKLKDVTKRYADGTEAVKRMNLEIKDGEFMILVGPSGCGKSTALRMIAGLEDISEGKLSIGDRVVNNLAPRDRDIAMVFQNYALYPHMTVRENMGFALKLAKVPAAEIDKKVEDAAQTLDLTEHLDRKPANLSGGQRQRVAMGRAIVRDPQVFLMDEPLSNLDAKLRVQTRAEIARLHQRLGTTTVYVTHDQVEAMTMGTRIAVMDKGELMQVGSPQDLYESPKKLFVAGFIGSPSMNFMNVVRDGAELKGDGFFCPIPVRYRSGVEGAAGPFVAGFRPEHFQLGDVPNSVTVRAKADVVEFLGDEELLHVTVAGHEGDIVAVVSSENRVKPGDILDLKLPLEKLHLFDTATGDSLAKTAAA